MSRRYVYFDTGRSGFRWDIGRSLKDQLAFRSRISGPRFKTEEEAERSLKRALLESKVYQKRPKLFVDVMARACGSPLTTKEVREIARKRQAYFGTGSSVSKTTRKASTVKSPKTQKKKGRSTKRASQGSPTSRRAGQTIKASKAKKTTANRRAPRAPRAPPPRAPRTRRAQPSVATTRSASEETNHGVNASKSATSSSREEDVTSTLPQISHVISLDGEQPTESFSHPQAEHAAVQVKPEFPTWCATMATIAPPDDFDIESGYETTPSVLQPFEFEALSWEENLADEPLGGSYSHVDEIMDPIFRFRPNQPTEQSSFGGALFSTPTNNYSVAQGGHHFRTVVA